MAPKIEIISEPMALGEGPHWDAATQSLYLIDFTDKNIIRYTPATKKLTKVSTGEIGPTLVIPIEGHKDKFLITQGGKVVAVTWDGESDKLSNVQVVSSIDGGKDLQIKFNDGKCDQRGRFWAGTIGFRENGDVVDGIGQLFNLGNDKKLKSHVSGITISNGMGWSVDGSKFYYIDSASGTVDEFDYDQNTATIANRKAIFTLSKHDISGLPDGMAVDADGNIWFAVFNGSRVLKIDPRKPETLLQTIELPALQTTSVAFGGPNLDELYVTSARFAFGGQPAPSGRSDGCLFRVTNIGAKGLPGVPVKLSL